MAIGDEEEMVERGVRRSEVMFTKRAKEVGVVRKCVNEVRSSVDAEGGR